jgi:hypothetical protein
VDPTGHDDWWAPSSQSGEINQAQERLKAHLGYLPLGVNSMSLAQLNDLNDWFQRGVKLIGTTRWTSNSLSTVLFGLNKVQAALGSNTDRLLGLADGLNVLNDSDNTQVIGQTQIYGATLNKDTVYLYEGGMNEVTLVHELGHIVDATLGGPSARGNALWSNGDVWQRIFLTYGSPTIYGSRNSTEDFAEVFAWYVFNKTYSIDGDLYGISQAPSHNRINALIGALTTTPSACYILP